MYALLAAGANPFRQLPLSEASKGCVHAVQFGHCGNIDALYEHSSRLMKQVDWAEFTTMQFTAFAMDAAKVHIVDGVEHDVTVDHVLSKYGAELGDVNATKGVGVNILCLTLTSVGSVATLRSLLDHGADPVYENPDMMKATNFINAMMVPFMGLLAAPRQHAPDGFGDGVAVWLAVVGRTSAWCRAPLLERGVDVNRRAKYTLYKPTALHLAALGGHEEVIALLAAGADAHARDSRGKTPAQWAAKRGHETVAALLVLRVATAERRTRSSGSSPDGSRPERRAWCSRRSAVARRCGVCVCGVCPHSPLAVPSCRRRHVHRRAASGAPRHRCIAAASPTPPLRRASAAPR